MTVQRHYVHVESPDGNRPGYDVISANRSGFFFAGLRVGHDDTVVICYSFFASAGSLKVANFRKLAIIKILVRREGVGIVPDHPFPTASND